MPGRFVVTLMGLLVLLGLMVVALLFALIA